LTVKEGVAKHLGGEKLDAVLNMAGKKVIRRWLHCTEVNQIISPTSNGHDSKKHKQVCRNEYENYFQNINTLNI
jgi:hypothetical protein